MIPMFLQAANGTGVQEQVNIPLDFEHLVKVRKVEDCFTCGLQVLVRKIIELHDKDMTYVNICFANHSLFHKVCAGKYHLFRPSLSLSAFFQNINHFECPIGPKRGF